LSEKYLWRNFSTKTEVENSDRDYKKEIWKQIWYWYLCFTKILNQFENISTIHYQFIYKQEKSKKKSNINIRVNEKMKLINEMEQYLLFMQSKWETKDYPGSKEILVELESIFRAEEEFSNHVASFVSYFNL
jgi:hypothetical protein